MEPVHGSSSSPARQQRERQHNHDRSRSGTMLGNPFEKLIQHCSCPYCEGAVWPVLTLARRRDALFCIPATEREAEHVMVLSCTLLPEPRLFAPAAADRPGSHAPCAVPSARVAAATGASPADPKRRRAWRYASRDPRWEATPFCASHPAGTVGPKIRPFLSRAQPHLRQNGRDILTSCTWRKAVPSSSAFCRTGRATSKCRAVSIPGDNRFAAPQPVCGLLAVALRTTMRSLRKRIFENLLSLSSVDEAWCLFHAREGR